MSATGVSTHVLDTARGRPAAGVAVILESVDASGVLRELVRGTTDADGRIPGLLPAGVTASGHYLVRFATADYFRSAGDPVFYPEVVIHVRLDAGQKYHIPLLLSPFGYTTYRGS